MTGVQTCALPIFFNIIGMAGGLGLFLYGMTILSSGLEKASGGLMEKVLAKMTGNVFSGILFGALVTAAVLLYYSFASRRIFRLYLSLSVLLS